MISGETILCFSPSSWFDLWRNRQQVMSRLAGANTVLFVEPQRDPGLPLLKDWQGKARSFIRPRLHRLSPQLIILSPPPGLPLLAHMLSPRLLRLWVPLAVNLKASRTSSVFTAFFHWVKELLSSRGHAGGNPFSNQETSSPVIDSLLALAYRGGKVFYGMGKRKL